MSDEKPMGQVIQIDEARIRDHLGEMVRGTVEETLNAMLEAEADRLCGAGRYERSEARQDTRAGSYDRTLQTSAGEVNLKVPKLRRQTFETAIIERYRRRESSVEEALIEMYLAGISVRRVEDITEALWGTRVSPSTVSNLNKKIYAKIEAWRNRRIDGEHPYLYLAQENREAADRKARAVVDDLRTARMNTAADLVERSVHETLAYYSFPDIHWQKIRTNNPLERIMREIRRRTRVVGAFPDGQSCLNLAAARLRHIAGTTWSAKCYMNMRPLYQPQIMQTGAVA